MIYFYFDRFMGALTALLVLAALMASLTSSLPDTSYFKVRPVFTAYYIKQAPKKPMVGVLYDNMCIKLIQ